MLALLGSAVFRLRLLWSTHRNCFDQPFRMKVFFTDECLSYTLSWNQIIFLMIHPKSFSNLASSLLCCSAGYRMNFNKNEN